MSTPRIEIDLEKIAHNVSRLMELYGSRSIGISAVTKAVCGNPDIAEVLVKTGVDILADSRIANIRKMRDAGIEAQFLLLRTPFLSQAEAVVRYADLSLNSEYQTQDHFDGGAGRSQRRAHALGCTQRC